MVFVPTSHSDGREFKPSTRSQPARLGGKVEQQDLKGSPWKIPCTRFAIRLTFNDPQLFSCVLRWAHSREFYRLHYPKISW